MKTPPLLLALLLIAFSGCSRREPPPEEDPNATNVPPDSVQYDGSRATPRTGPGEIGGTETRVALEPLDALDPPGEPDPMIPSPSLSTDTQSSGVVSGQTPEDLPGRTPAEGYFLSYRATPADPTSAGDAFSFRTENRDRLLCTFNRNFSQLHLTARARLGAKDPNTRKIDFKIGGFRREQTAYVYPWRTFASGEWVNSPDGKGTPFSVQFLYVLPQSAGFVKGLTRVIPDAGHENPYANEECSECTLSVHINETSSTVRGTFACQQLWSYPDVFPVTDAEKGPVSITGEFHLPYVQN
jgi:hypothetical protein